MFLRPKCLSPQRTSSPSTFSLFSSFVRRAGDSICPLGATTDFPVTEWRVERVTRGFIASKVITLRRKGWRPGGPGL